MEWSDKTTSGRGKNNEKVSLKWRRMKNLFQNVNIILPLRRVNCWRKDDRMVLRQESRRRTTRVGNLRQSVLSPIPPHPCVKRKSYESWARYLLEWERYWKRLLRGSCRRRKLPPATNGSPMMNNASTITSLAIVRRSVWTNAAL